MLMKKRRWLCTTPMCTATWLSVWRACPCWQIHSRAIKYARVRCIRDAGTGLITDFEVEGDYPAFGNDDDRVDAIACEQAEAFYNELRRPCAVSRRPKHTLSVLTITSNVVYGKKTGSTPDGRKAGAALCPGREPHARPGEKRRAGLC